MTAGYTFTLLPIVNRENLTINLKTSSFIILSPEDGPILFDTGSPYNSEMLLHFLKNQFDLNPEDIRWVFNTHVHPDHCGNNRYFTKAKLIFSQEELFVADQISEIIDRDGNLLEFLYRQFPGYIHTYRESDARNMKRYFRDYWHQDIIGVSLKPEFIENKPDIPDFIRIIPTPGHSNCHYAYFIKLKSINLLITGDALSSRAVLNEPNELRYSEHHADHEQYFQSLKLIKEFKGMIVPGHDRPFFTHDLSSVKMKKFNLEEIQRDVFL